MKRLSSPRHLLWNNTRSSTRAPSRRIITRTLHPTACNVHIHKLQPLTRPVSTQDIIIPGPSGRRARHVLKQQVLDQHAVRRVARRPAVEIVLLHVDTVRRDALQGDVGVGDVGDEAGGVEVGLDAAAVFGGEDGGVGKLI